MPAMPLFGASFPAFADVAAATPPPPTFAGGGTFSFPARGCPRCARAHCFHFVEVGVNVTMRRFPIWIDTLRSALVMRIERRGRLKRARGILRECLTMLSWSAVTNCL